MAAEFGIHLDHGGPTCLGSRWWSEVDWSYDGRDVGDQPGNLRPERNAHGGTEAEGPTEPGKHGLTGDNGVLTRRRNPESKPPV